MQLNIVTGQLQSESADTERSFKVKFHWDQFLVTTS